MSESYAEYLRSAQWREVSKERRRIDGYKCVCCGSDNNLNVHHAFYPKDIYETNTDCLVTLCKDCHLLVHRMQEKVDKFPNRKITKNGFIDERGGALYREMMRLIIVGVWKNNLFSLSQVKEYVRKIEDVFNKSGRGYWRYDLTTVMPMLAMVKDCYIANKSPTFDSEKVKTRRMTKTRFK